jgi:molybdopterin-guanine dinucleotide biosynthesis protein A
VARQMLEQGVSSLKALVGSLPTIRVSATDLRAVDPDLTAFTPVNTPEEYAAALARRPRPVD